MVAEAQYGGRITDDLDRELFNTYAAKWFCSSVSPWILGATKNGAFHRLFQDFPLQKERDVGLQSTGDLSAAKRRALHLATDSMARLGTGYSAISLSFLPQFFCYQVTIFGSHPSPSTTTSGNLSDFEVAVNS